MGASALCSGLRRPSTAARHSLTSATLRSAASKNGEAIVVAEADLRIAEANLDNAQAIVEEKEAALDQAEQDLARTEIRSPIDGVIIKRDINPGQTVASQPGSKDAVQHRQ